MRKTRGTNYFEQNMMILRLDMLCLKTKWNVDIKTSEFRGKE